MTSQPKTRDTTGHSPRATISVVLLVAAALLAPIVLIAGFAWPIFESLQCRSSCGHSWTGPIVIWVAGAGIVSGLAYLGVRGIVRPPPPPQPSRPDMR